MMTKEQFIEKLIEDLELESELTLETDIKSLDEWDSMSAMVLIGVVSNEFDLELTADDLQEITTVQSLMDRIGIEKFS